MGIVGTARAERVWESKLRENFVAIVGELAPKDTEEVIRGLERHIEKTVPAAKLVQCDVCSGHSSEDFDGCPFCADQGPEQAPAPAESGVVATAEKTKDPEPENDPTAIDATKLEAEGVELEKPKGKKTSTKTAAKEAGKAEAAEKKKVKPPPANKPKPSAPAIDIAEAKPVVTEKDLDAQLQAYRDAGEKNATAFWHMGVAISKIHDRLWQQRQLEGKQKYKSWNMFVDAELGITVAHANRLRGVAVNFTEETAAKYGPGILMVIARAPKEEHAKLMDKVDQEKLTTRQLEKKVQEVREAKGVTVNDAEDGKSRRDPRATKEKTEKAAAARKKPQAAITLGLKAETGVLPYLVQPTPQSEAYPATEKELEAGAFLKIEGINGVDLFVTIQKNEKGELIGRYIARRQAEE